MVTELSTGVPLVTQPVPFHHWPSERWMRTFTPVTLTLSVAVPVMEVLVPPSTAELAGLVMLLLGAELSTVVKLHCFWRLRAFPARSSPPGVTGAVWGR